MDDLPVSQDLAYRFDALYQWLSRRFPLELVEQTIGGTTFRIYKIAQVDEVLDDIIARHEVPDDYTPYWTELWPSAIGMAHYLFSQEPMKGRVALELGCGLGLTGMAAATRGASVVLSDLEDDALRLATLNWILNFMEEPAILKLDWRNPQISQKFDLLLASDVAYEEKQFYPLVQAFDQLLEPMGEVILSEPNRKIAEKFFVMLKQFGFAWKKNDQEIFYQGRDSVISIYRIRRIR